MFSFNCGALVWSALYCQVSSAECAGGIVLFRFSHGMSTIEPPPLQCVVDERTDIVVLVGPPEACGLNAVASYAPLVTLFTGLQHNDFLMCVCSECALTFTILRTKRRVILLLCLHLQKSGIKTDLLLTLPLKQDAQFLVKYTLLTPSPALQYQETERTGGWLHSHLSDLCLAESLVNGPETDSDVLTDRSCCTHMAVHKSTHTCTHRGPRLSY